MSSCINKVTLIGYLGQDPEVVGKGSVTKFSIATNRSWTDKESGEKKSETEWHRVTLFGKLAEIAAKYIHKGSHVYLEGRIQSRKYTDKNDIERFITEIIGNEIRFLGDDSKKEKPKANNNQNDFQEDEDIPF